MNVRSILVVCVGNMCRSPTGEYLLKSALPGVDIASAGLMARNSHPPCGTALEIAARHGVDMSPHQTRRLTQEMIVEHDLILAMESDHNKEILKVAPFAQGKVMLFGRWEGDIEIPDPYKHSEAMYEAVFSQLEVQARHWVNKLDQSK